LNFSIFTAQERIIPRRNRAGLYGVSFANFLFFLSARQAIFYNSKSIFSGGK